MREVRDKNGSLIASYLYDADNRRIRKDLATGTDVDYHYAGWRVLAEYENGGANPKRHFVYGIGLDEPLVMDINEDNDEYTTEGVDSRYFYHQNTLGSVYGLSNEDGEIVEAYEYDPYGKHWVIYNNGNAITFTSSDSRTTQGLSNYGNPYLFTGRRFDSESKLQYSRYRYYSPTLGRFISRDPIGFGAGPNLYGYVGSAPTYFTDPLGLDKIVVDKGNGGAVYWVIENDGWIVNRDLRRIEIGYVPLKRNWLGGNSIAGDVVLHPEFSGATVPLDNLRKRVGQYWGRPYEDNWPEHITDISSLWDEMQIRTFLDLHVIPAKGPILRPPRQSWNPKRDRRLEPVHTGLQSLGLIKGLGDLADFVDGCVYACQGKRRDALISFSCMVPLSGEITASARLAKRLKKRNPIFVDNNVLIAAERGSANALKEIRAGTTYITPNQLREFLNKKAIPSGQIKSRKKFLQSEGIAVFCGPKAKHVASGSDFQQVFQATVRSHGRADAALGAFARETGYEAITMEGRLQRYFDLTRPDLNVPIRRINK